MNTRIHMKNPLLLTSLFIVFCLIFPIRGWGQGAPRIQLDMTSPQKLNLTVGKSVIITTPQPIKRVSLASPDVADTVVVTPQQLYLTAKAPGSTTLTFWESDDRVSAVVQLEVTPDISRFKEALYKVLPEEKDVQATATHESITLSGNVSSTAALSQILALAESYFPKKVVNLMQVGGVHQVMLEVRVAEISRSLMRRLGINFTYLSSSGQTFGLTLLNNLTRIPTTGFPGSDLGVSDTISAIFRFLQNGATWTVFVDVLKQEGLLNVLAEPTLITLSGRKANFLAGGEYPIPVPQTGAGGFVTITIAYKPYGVALNFTPTVLDRNKISMQVAPEVSELDFSKSVVISGYVVPALTTRRVSTAIELGDGQSFAIAGLLKTDVREVVNKYPLLGDIPILGALFRSTEFQKNETELIIIVTPRLVKPMDLAKQTLPTDQYIEPDDFEWYLLGKLEGADKKKSSPPGAAPPAGVDKDLKLEGKFGHITQN